MIGRYACLILAAGLFMPGFAHAAAEIDLAAEPDLAASDGLSGAAAETVQGENAPQAAALTAPLNAAPSEKGAEANPLWSVPLSALTATKERPVFSPSRRAPQPTAEPEPLADAEPPPPPPPEAETPSLTLVGTVINEPESIAIIHDDKTNTTVRVHTGESVSGWVLVSVEPGTMTLEKNSQTATVTMPPLGAAPPQGPMMSQADQSSGAF
ncbi:MAG TPA: hypothetical protein VFG05_12440 [Methylocella sp.]|nr:hypothetical protein [Methylocella sp.]